MFDITNYSDHPTRIGHTVFKFRTKQRAEYFESLLKKDEIWYEYSDDEEDSLYLFGVKKGDFKAAMNANYLVSAKFRNKIFPNKYFRIILFTIAAVILILAIIGVIKT